MFNLSIFIYIFNEDYLSNVSSINFFNSFFPITPKVIVSFPFTGQSSNVGIFSMSKAVSRASSSSTFIQ